MKRKRVQFATLLITVTAMGAAMAGAQSAPQTTAGPGTPVQNPARTYMAETDAAVSIYRTFTQSTTGNATLQTPSNGYGGMFELRHIQSPWIGYEVAEGFNQANQGYAPAPGACALLCGNKPETITADADEVGLNWVISTKRGKFSPFAVGGMGFDITIPTENLPTLNTVVRIMYDYGGGVDVGVLPHAGLRLQYRGHVYKAPDLDVTYGATDRFTESGEAMIGVYFPL